MDLIVDQHNHKNIQKITNQMVCPLASSMTSTAGLASEVGSRSPCVRLASGVLESLAAELAAVYMSYL